MPCGRTGLVSGSDKASSTQHSFFAPDWAKWIDGQLFRGVGGIIIMAPFVYAAMHVMDAPSIRRIFGLGHSHWNQLFLVNQIRFLTDYEFLFSSIYIGIHS